MDGVTVRRLGTHLSLKGIQLDGGRPRTGGDITEFSENHIFKLHFPFSEAPLFAYLVIESEQLSNMNDKPMQEVINNSHLRCSRDRKYTILFAWRFLEPACYLLWESH